MTRSHRGHGPGIKRIGASTDNAIVRWDNTTGSLIQDSDVLLTDGDDITWVVDGDGNIGYVDTGRPNAAYLVSGVNIGDSALEFNNLAQIDASGGSVTLRDIHLLVETDGGSDLGASGATRFNNAYFKNDLAVGNAIALGHATTSHITWVTDGGGDIGASGATRPNNAYIKTNLAVGNAITLGHATTSHITWDTDGGGDIGAAATSRPDNVYATTSVNVGNGGVIAGTTTLTMGAGSSANVIWTTDAAGNIGGSLSDNRPNAAYLASGVNIGDNTLEVGTPPHSTAIDTADVGVMSRNTSNTLVLLSQRSSGSGNVSVALVADVEAAAIDADHEIADIGWYDNTGTYHGSWAYKDATFESADASVAELLGTEADGGAVVGTRVGAVEDFTTPGAKLLQVVNDETEERMYVDYQGAVGMHRLDNNQSLVLDVMEDLITIQAAASTNSSITIPSGCQVWAISNNVTVSIPDVSSMMIGVTGDTDRYGAGLGVGAGANHHGMDAGAVYYSAATPVIVTPSQTPSAATGKVRVTVHYLKATPATS